MAKDKLNILLVASEVVPFAKTGGLADVAGSLPKALAGHGHDVRIALPRYQFISGVDYYTDLPVKMDGHLETGIIRRAHLPSSQENQKKSLPVYLIDNYKFFFREGMYGYADEAARFNFFCKATLSMLPRIDFKPDVIHCNDWQTAMIPLFLKVFYQDEPFYQQIATLFTVHNLQYQGRFPKDTLSTLGLGNEFFTSEQIEYYGQINFLKAGLIYADLLNTVSKKYALEIQTPSLGEGLDGLLRHRAADLYGIINGIDYEEWDPEKLPHAYKTTRLEGKRENKKQLQRQTELPVIDVPVIGFISRLVNQKGLDLVAAIMDNLMQQDVQLILLGSGEDYYQQLFSQLKVKYRDRIAVKIGFDADLAQLIYAGADMFLMPSRFEPCGLGQLISLRYGTIPIVRATGGLEDTITDYHQDPTHGNGFVFSPYNPHALWETIQRALQTYWNKPESWHQLIINAMQANFSWSSSATQYLELYQRAIEKRRSATSIKKLAWTGT
jgi:starch synthase